MSAFSEHAVIDARSAVRVDDDLPYDVAAVFGCAVLTGVGAAVHAAGVQEGDRVAVFGLGGVGLAAVMGAQMAGAAEVFAVDLLPDKLRRAAGLGATAVAGGEEAVGALREATGGGVEKIIDATGKIDGLTQAYAATRRGGMTVTVGLPHPSHALQVPATALVLEERTLKGSYMGNCVPSRDIPRFVEAYREGRLPVDQLLTHRIALDDINEGFDRLRDGEAVRQAVVFSASGQAGPAARPAHDASATMQRAGAVGRAGGADSGYHYDAGRGGDAGHRSAGTPRRPQAARCGDGQKTRTPPECWSADCSSTTPARREKPD